MEEMLHQKSTIEQIENLIIEGVEITHDSSDVIFSPNDYSDPTNFYVWEIKHKYVIWKLKCNNLLQKLGYKNTIFTEGDSISLTSGAIMEVPISPVSKEGKKMFTDIRTETSKKIDVLREIIKDEKIVILEKKKVILYTKEKEAKICLIGNKQLCYSIKGDNPDRFKIVCILFSVELGKSAREIANFLHKDGNNKIIQDRIKKEINEINILFKNNCLSFEKLIDSNKNKGKNIYFLNRDKFIFEKQK